MLRQAVFALCLVLGLHSICSSFAADTRQPGKVWRIGVIGNLSPASNPDTAKNFAALRQVLEERGYVEGRNFVLEQRYLEGKPEGASEFAVELVHLKVDLIMVTNELAARVARTATSTIPIVMAGAGDPVGVGLVASLAHPGGNITGATDSLDLTPKRLELLKAAIPSATRVAYIRCPKCATAASALEVARKNWDAWAATAQHLGMTLAFVDLNGPQDLDDAMTTVLRARPDAVFAGASWVNFALRKELVGFAMRERLPMVAPGREFAVLGALAAYGIDYADLYRKAAVYIDKIFKGAKPADLPVEQPTKFELVINLKTAKALGLTIPQSLLLRADEIIQ